MYVRYGYGTIQRQVLCVMYVTYIRERCYTLDTLDVGVVWVLYGATATLQPMYNEGLKGTTYQLESSGCSTYGG
jgi:hypothetical protein